MRRQDTTHRHDGHGEPAATSDTERGTPCDRSSADRRAQGHAPAHPPFRIGDTVNHATWGTGTVNGTCQWDARWNGWWVPVQFTAHSTRVLGKLLWTE